jgi:uncharacterized protein YebE (UPF0316 family)
MENDRNYTGRDYASQGRQCARSIYPKAKERKAAAKRVARRARAFLTSNDPRLINIGFFLHGVAEASRAVRS